MSAFAFLIKWKSEEELWYVRHEQTHKEGTIWVSSQQKLGRGEEKRETTGVGQLCLGFTDISVSLMLIMWETLVCMGLGASFTSTARVLEVDSTSAWLKTA